MVISRTAQRFVLTVPVLALAATCVMSRANASGYISTMHITYAWYMSHIALLCACWVHVRERIYVYVFSTHTHTHTRCIYVHVFWTHTHTQTHTHTHTHTHTCTHLLIQRHSTERINSMWRMGRRSHAVEPLSVCIHVGVCRCGCNIAKFALATPPAALFDRKEKKRKKNKVWISTKIGFCYHSPSGQTKGHNND